MSRTSIRNITNTIISKIKPEWNKDEIIRFVYIKLGQKINKNVNFFYSLGEKLESKNYTYKELKRIYEAKQVYSTSVICKTSALFLKKIYDELGIECELIQTISSNPKKNKDNDESFNIHHWFLCVTGENGRKYFLTLIPDLANIQFNLPTKHFANRIDYMREGPDGQMVQTYYGEERHVHPMSEEELKAIDEKIGYIHPYYEEINGERKKIARYDDIFIEYLRDYIRQKKYIGELGYETDFYKKIKSFKINNLPIDQYLNTREFDMEKIELWIDYVREQIAETFEIDSKLYKDSIGKLSGIKAAIENNDAQKYRTLIDLLCRNFVDTKYQIKQNGECTTEYVAHKFEYLFPRMFECNDELFPPLTARFTGLAEQLDFIDMFLENMFLELKNAKANRGKTINPKYSLVRNRIQRYAIYNKKLKNYSIIFSIDHSNIYYKFDPNSGEFKKVSDFLELISENYIIISDELRDRIREIEAVEHEETQVETAQANYTISPNLIEEITNEEQIKRI